MRFYWLAASTVLLATPTLAAKYSVDFVATPNQYSRLNQGVEVVDSVVAPTVVRVVEPEDWSKNRASIVIVTYNGGTDPFNFGPEDVTLIMPDGTRRGMAPFDQLVTEERSRQRGRAFALALGAIGRGMQASEAGNFNGTVSTWSGRPVATFSGTDYGARAQAQAYANAETHAQAEQLRQRNDEGMATLGDVLRTTTVDPGKAMGGRVLFAFPKEWRKNGTYPVKLEVVAGGMTHTFYANVTRK